MMLSECPDLFDTRALQTRLDHIISTNNVPRRLRFSCGIAKTSIPTACSNYFRSSPESSFPSRVHMLPLRRRIDSNVGKAQICCTRDWRRAKPSVRKEMTEDSRSIFAISLIQTSQGHLQQYIDNSS